MNDSPDTMSQVAPYPAALATLVQRLRYRDGWRFNLTHLDRGQGSRGLTLVINITGPDAYHPERKVSVDHLMIVPPAAFDERSWLRWLFDQILLVEQHEAMEWFQISIPDAPAGTWDWRDRIVRPYAPSHGPGNDPYMIREVGTDEDRRTSFRGEVSPS